MIRKSTVWLWVPCYFKARNANNKKKQYVSVRSKNKQSEERSEHVLPTRSAHYFSGNKDNNLRESTNSKNITADNINSKERESHLMKTVQEHDSKSEEMRRLTQRSYHYRKSLSISQYNPSLRLLVCKAQTLLNVLRAEKMESLSNLIDDHHHTTSSSHIDCEKKMREWRQNLINSLHNINNAQKLSLIALIAQREVLSQLMHAFTLYNREFDVQLTQTSIEFNRNRFVVVPDNKMENCCYNTNVEQFEHTQNNEEKKIKEQKQGEQAFCSVECEKQSLCAANKDTRTHTETHKVNTKEEEQLWEVNYTCAKLPLFMLEELVNFFTLYEKIKCDDGKLLQLLLEDVNKFLYNFVACTNASAVKLTHEEKLFMNANSIKEFEEVAKSERHNSSPQTKDKLFFMKNTKLPLPELLLVLSKLGIAQENTLQLLTFHSKREVSHSEKNRSIAKLSKTTKKKNKYSSTDRYNDNANTFLNSKKDSCEGLLFQQLAEYDMNQLIILLVALQRFKMLDEHICVKVVSTIHTKLKTDRELRDYMHMCRLTMRELIANNAPDKNHKIFYEQSHFVNERNEQNVKEDNIQFSEYKDLNEQLVNCYVKYGKQALATAEILHHIPYLHCSELLTFELLLDALKSLLYGAPKSKDVILFIGNLIVQHALVQIDNLLTESSPSSVSLETRELEEECCNEPEVSQYNAQQTDWTKQRGKPIVEIAKQMLDVSRLCEEMQCANALLRIMFMWCTTLTRRGVVIDGGEDAEVTSESRACYDHVTADLIKMRYVK